MKERNKEVMSAIRLAVALEIVAALFPASILNFVIYHRFGKQNAPGMGHPSINAILVLGIFIVSAWIAHSFAKKYRLVDRIIADGRKEAAKKLGQEKQNAEREDRDSDADFEKKVQDLKDILAQYRITGIRQIGRYDFELSFNGKLSTTMFDKKSIALMMREYDLFIPNTLPLVRLENAELQLYQISGNKATIKIDTTLPNSEILDFHCGENKFQIGNPYWFVFEENDSRIVCQLEGSATERNIYISKECFPYLSKELSYLFCAYRNDRLLGKFSGKFSEKEDCVKIPLGKTLDKADYITGQCYLRYYFGSNVLRIALPEPMVVSMNNKLVKEAIF